VSVPVVGDVVKHGRGFLEEFRAFAIRGNVVDLAVGVVIGAAFGKIVTTLVDGVIMPPIGLLVGRVDMTSLEWVLRPADPLKKTPKIAIEYGVFINTIIQFLIIAFAVFLMVKLINRLRESEAAHPQIPPAPTPTEKLLTEIRDELRSERPASKTGS
jgi:large conductance mechanosensitive channel